MSSHSYCSRLEPRDWSWETWNGCAACALGEKFPSGTVKGTKTTGSFSLWWEALLIFGIMLLETLRRGKTGWVLQGAELCGLLQAGGTWLHCYQTLDLWREPLPGTRTQSTRYQDGGLYRAAAWPKDCGGNPNGTGIRGHCSLELVVGEGGGRCLKVSLEGRWGIQHKELKAEVCNGAGHSDFYGLNWWGLWEGLQVSQPIKRRQRERERDREKRT